MRRAAARKRQRMLLVVVGLSLLGVATALMLVAFQDNVMLFHGPTEIQNRTVETGKRFRLGGLVAEDSVRKEGGGITTVFGVTDGNAVVTVRYTGIMPDLFREGQGVVTQGELGEDGVFAATEVLAKHDETYMPPEVVEAMKRAGTWKGDGEELGETTGETGS